ncbi:hypothetical protein ACO2FM_00005 [Staphylococcus pasteuri]
MNDDTKELVVKELEYINGSVEELKAFLDRYDDETIIGRIVEIEARAQKIFNNIQKRALILLGSVLFYSILPH